MHRCNGKFKGDEKCKTPTLAPEEIQTRFLEAYNQMMGNREALIEDCEVMKKVLTDCSVLDQQIRAITQEIEVIAGLVQTCVNENATTALSQEEYNRKYNGLVNRYEKAMVKLNALKEEKALRIARNRELHIFIEMLKTQPLILGAWDAQLWNILLEKATVFQDGSIVFEFKNQTKITI